jgi:hypothetical protein
MNPSRYLGQLPYPDGGEVQEWVDSVDGLVDARGTARAGRVLLHVMGRVAELGIGNFNYVFRQHAGDAT